eukprot:1448047-Amphidinium_carterae.1
MSESLVCSTCHTPLLVTCTTVSDKNIGPSSRDCSRAMCNCQKRLAPLSMKGEGQFELNG